MSQIKLRIGASLDANATAVFTPLIKASERARDAIRKNLNDATKAGAGGKGAGGAKHNVDSLDRELDRMANRILKNQDRAAREANRIEAASQKQRTREAMAGAKAREKLERDADRQARQSASQAAAAHRAAARQQLAPSGRIGQRAGSGGGAIGIGRRAGLRVPRGVAAAYGYGGSLVGGAIGMGETYLRGMGVETDVGSMIETGVHNQARAQKIINSDPNSKGMSASARQSAARGLLGEAQSVGTATGTSTADTLEALDAFVAKTGELRTAQDSIQGLAMLAKATGTNLADMANAAAEVSNNLGDVPDKGKAVYDVMRAVAGQGQLGAVEIKDLASQMAKLASQAGAFEGDKGKNIAILGAMAQESKLRGGSASAQQATTSVMAFTANLTKGATLKNWRNASYVENGKTYGMSPYTDQKQTTLRSPQELVLMALRSTKGSLPGLQKLFGSAQSMRAVRGFANIYNESGGGQAGLKAVEEEFQRLTAAAMSQEDVMRGFDAQMRTSESQVAVFNNEMQAAAESIAGSLNPAFAKLAPEVALMAGSFANLVANLTGATRDKAVEEADALPTGTADKDIANIKNLVTPGNDGVHLDAYNPESVEVLKSHGAKRGQAMADLGGAIETEGREADEQHQTSRSLKILTLGMYDGGLEESSKGNRANAATDALKLAGLQVEQAKTNDVLRQIYSGIQAGNAIMQKLTVNRPPPPGHTPGGAADPNSHEPH